MAASSSAIAPPASSSSSSSDLSPLDYAKLELSKQSLPPLEYQHRVKAVEGILTRLEDTICCTQETANHLVAPALHEDVETIPALQTVLSVVDPFIPRSISLKTIPALIPDVLKVINSYLKENTHLENAEAQEFVNFLIDRAPHYAQMYGLETLMRFCINDPGFDAKPIDNIKLLLCYKTYHEPEESEEVGRRIRMNLEVVLGNYFFIPEPEGRTIKNGVGLHKVQDLDVSLGSRLIFSPDNRPGIPPYELGKNQKGEPLVVSSERLQALVRNPEIIPPILSLGKRLEETIKTMYFESCFRDSDYEMTARMLLIWVASKRLYGEGREWFIRGFPDRGKAIGEMVEKIKVARNFEQLTRLRAEQQARQQPIVTTISVPTETQGEINSVADATQLLPLEFYERDQQFLHQFNPSPDFGFGGAGFDVNWYDPINNAYREDKGDAVVPVLGMDAGSTPHMLNRLGGTGVIVEAKAEETKEVAQAPAKKEDPAPPAELNTQSTFEMAMAIHRARMRHN